MNGFFIDENGNKIDFENFETEEEMLEAFNKADKIIKAKKEKLKKELETKLAEEKAKKEEAIAMFEAAQAAADEKAKNGK